MLSRIFAEVSGGKKRAAADWAAQQSSSQFQI
jgi:hypothetical protein